MKQIFSSSALMMVGSVYVCEGVCGDGGTSAYNNFILVVSSLTNDGKRRGNTMGEGTQEIIILEDDASPSLLTPHCVPLFCSLFTHPNPNIHFRSAISNVSGPLLA